MEQGIKRKAETDARDSEDKRSRNKKQWHVPRKNDRGAIRAQAIQPGDSGIFATCNKGRERGCIGELRDLFSEYAEVMYPEAVGAGEAGIKAEDGDDDVKGDIENDIQAEIAGIRKPATAQLFTPIKLEVQCVVFFKTIAPVDPVKLVQRICEDAMSNPQRKRTRSAKRLAPMTFMGKASLEGLRQVAVEVLKPHFHQEPVQPRSFAIRPNLRNHNILSRDTVIKEIASLVGKPHTVNLKGFELLILVEVYQNICGVSVVDQRYEQLKRYNLAEIFDPTPKEVAQQVKEKLAEPVEATQAADEKPPLSSAPVEGTPAATMDLS